MNRLFVCFLKVRVSTASQETYGEMEVQLHEFLTSAREWSAALPNRLIHTEIKVWVNPKAGLDSFIHSVFCLTTGPKPPQKHCAS